MKPDVQEVSGALNRLFLTYPSFQVDDPAATLKVYFEAVSEYETQDVLAAIHGFIIGIVPGHNAAFAPSAPQVGAASRLAMHQRLDSENRERRLNALPPPQIEHDAESQERVRKMAAKAVERLAASLRTDEAAAELRQSKRLAEHDDRFIGRRSEREIARSLGLSAGDPDGEAA